MLLLDEAQDTNKVIQEIFNSQATTKIAVGDSHQQIYKWRGAKDGLKKLDGEKYHLTNSFRIGQDLADLCNLIIEDFKESQFQIKGLNDTQRISKVNKNEQFTILCRTRAKVFDNAIQLMKEGKSVYFESGIQGYHFRTFVEA